MKRAKRGWDLGTRADKERNGKGGALKKSWRARLERRGWGGGKMVSGHRATCYDRNGARND